MISEEFQWIFPVAHAPIDISTTPEDTDLWHISKEVIDSRMGAEVMSVGYLHCVLKGLHTAPLPRDSGLSYEDVSFLISPDNCWGIPHETCLRNNIPIVVVAENATVANARVQPDVIRVQTYLEAAGIIMAIRAKILPDLVRWPRNL